MSKVFMIIGKSFSGKDTLLNSILQNKQFCEENNLHKLVRYTTRKIRPNEVEGEDYHFIDDEYHFREFKDNDMCVATSYNSDFGKLYYITDFSKLDKDKNYILTGDVESIRPFKEILGDNLCLIWLLPPDWVLFERFSKRDDSTEYSEKKYQEIQRRYVDDLFKFNQANKFIANTPVIINLGKFVNETKIQDQMEDFIDDDFDSVILTIENTTRFKNDYVPNVYIESLTLAYDNINSGVIRICNTGVILNTKEESFTISDKYKIQ